MTQTFTGVWVGVADTVKLRFYYSIRNAKMNTELLSKLAEFITDWRNIAKLDGIELQDIQVNLVSVLSDICELAEVNPIEIGLTVKEIA